jgi:hypothetical protein
VAQGEGSGEEGSLIMSTIKPHILHSEKLHYPDGGTIPGMHVSILNLAIVGVQKSISSLSAMPTSMFRSSRQKAKQISTLTDLLWQLCNECHMHSPFSLDKSVPLSIAEKLEKAKAAERRGLPLDYALF